MAIKMIITFVLLLSTLSIIILPPPSISQILPSSSSKQGEWNLLHASIGISAMHMQLLRDNKVLIFDRTDFGPSNLSLSGGRCRFDPFDSVLQNDCTAHSVLYDIGTNTFRPLMVQTDTWCSSGSVLPNGTLVQTGGYNDGDHVVRTFSPSSDDNSDWVEFPGYLSARRWYATNQILPDGRIIIVGGRRQFNYEFYPRNSDESSLAAASNTFWLEFLRETRDQDENNLYPFLHLLPDGNLFIFANTRSISLDYNRNLIVREFPAIPSSDPRNYPSSGSSVLLPLDENKPNIEAEIMVCGGAPLGAFSSAMHGNFIQASLTCGRMKVNDQNPNWVMENMPQARVMGDMLLLPTGNIIIINGAGLGTASWRNARDPVTTPVIYRPTEHNCRFSIMAPSPRPRMYHSSATLLTDGRILVGGSNPQPYYNFSGVDFPTDLSLEAYSPPYLSVDYVQSRPRILFVNEVLGYREVFSVSFTVPEFSSANVVSVRIIAPSFTTHSLAMNQRLVVLKMVSTLEVAAEAYELVAVGPSTAEIAPPGYYLLFVLHAGIPSSGVWVKIQ